MTDTPLAITMHPADNVAIIANDAGLPAGKEVAGVTLLDRIPQGHKLALRDIPEGGEVRRYNVVIGFAAQALPAGSWVYEHRLTMPPAPDVDALPMATRVSDPGPAIEGRTFMGYRNADGSVGTRNLLAITSTVHCVSGIVDHAVRRIREELLPKYPNVDGVLALDHIYGCGVAIDAPDAVIPIRTLRHISMNPNFGGEVMTVSLGCEKLQPDRLFPEFQTDLVRLQDETGYAAMIRQIMTQAKAHLERLNARTRTPCPVSDLVVGMQCGGSDAFSGVTANPALGYAADMLVRAGATVMFSENTEVRDGIDQLTARAACPGVAQEIIDQLTWYDAYLDRGQVDRAANTTPGNKAGGLSNIVEKAMGSIVKSGSAPIMAVIPPGERAQTRGLNYAATPASDFICGTLQLAAGCTLHVFTTGRGTPYSLQAMPTLKVATRSQLARRWHDLIDIDAGPVATGEETIQSMGERLFEEYIATASGRPTWAERHGIHNSLALFNPAPVT
ncbi:galactarate dehydratase [Tropicibacter naphthalenivorans]|uniref:Galactarate dehydratase n=1 Tax=Tropicibacter naphthalenivorans TaxID=441103 RepID=A0A0N7M179_9RHOB|nr:galactarate dehydratase [Tropicibacter naphthalenivorans]CUH82513.1 D-galactarate dehydratase [Tropicibacter naphthalenivorans]SMD06846.1 galactarate dehydratase [Tropicibacter naphthalenivorans]